MLTSIDLSTTEYIKVSDKTSYSVAFFCFVLFSYQNCSYRTFKGTSTEKYRTLDYKTGYGDATAILGSITFLVNKGKRVNTTLHKEIYVDER